VRAVEIVGRDALHGTPSPPATMESSEDELIPISDVRAAIEAMDESEDSEDVAFDMALGDPTESEEDETSEAMDDDDVDEDQNDNDEDDENENDDDPDDDDEEGEGEEEDDDDESSFGSARHIYQSAHDKRRLREEVESEVPCMPHTRVYRGHCNVKTVKDVNFFGLDDEYVISGSDEGNFFVWDRKTTKLVNILQGDGEVVNVLQGHPYETMLAVSGIDHTIKIFSPDARAREAARLGRGIQAADTSDFSSVQWPLRLGGRRAPRRSSGNAASEPAAAAPVDQYDDEYVAPNGLASRKRIHDEYQITTQNDISRQGGNQEAYITVQDLLSMLLGGQIR